MSEPVTCAQSFITQPTNATEEIDRILKAALIHSRPVYLSIPSDLFYAQVSSSSLRSCLRTQVTKEIEAQVDLKVIESVLNQISDLFLKSKKPILIVSRFTRQFFISVYTSVFFFSAKENSSIFFANGSCLRQLDVCSIRFGVQSKAIELVEALQIPFYTTPMAKGILNESHELFGGIYAGRMTDSRIKEEVESSDLTICLGGVFSDSV